MKARWQFACILLLATLLAACGFQLRGSGASARLPFQTIYLNLPAASPVGIDLRRYLQASGTTITATPEEAEVILDVLSESRDKEILTRNSQGRIREYTLFYRLEVKARSAQNAALMPATTVTATRVLSFDESQALAKEAEEATLYRDMQTDLVQQILRRLAALPLVPAQGTGQAPEARQDAAVAVPVPSTQEQGQAPAPSVQP